MSNYMQTGQDLNVGVLAYRTLKQDKVPFIFMHVDESSLKKLKPYKVQTYHVSHRSISLSGDVKKNPTASDQCTRHLVACLSVDNVDSVSFLETRLSDR